MRPTAHFKFFSSAFLANSSIRLAEGLSATTGFSMNTFSPRSMAYSKWSQRKASGVARIAMSPGRSTSIAFL